jgi:hypothetical protein
MFMMTAKPQGNPIMTHILFEHGFSEAKPRRYPNMEDNQGGIEEVYDPYDEEDSQYDDATSEGEEELEDEEKDSPPSNGR